ncbi:MAG: gamma-glutamyltransferase [Pseudomonadota bacterium]
MGAGLKAYFDLRAQDLARLEETKQTLRKPDGSVYEVGELFRQPALAQTLRLIAEQGADYMYKGAWAKRAVAAIQREGGKMTLEDLSRYEAIQSDAVKVQYDDYTAYFPGQPCLGTATLVESVNIARAADIRSSGHWSGSAESLRKLALCCGASGGLYFEHSDQGEEGPWAGFDMSWSNRLTRTMRRPCGRV